MRVAHEMGSGMTAARALRANCMRNCERARVGAFALIFSRRSRRDRRGHHRGRPIVGGHPVIVGGILRRRTAVTAGTVRTAGEASDQQQHNQWDANHGHQSLPEQNEVAAASANLTRLQPGAESLPAKPIPRRRDKRGTSLKDAWTHRGGFRFPVLRQALFGSQIAGRDLLLMSQAHVIGDCHGR